MTHRIVTHIIILILFGSALCAAFLYGPYQRKYLSTQKTVPVTTGAEMDKLWRMNSVHGRVAVLFTRHLKPQQDGRFPEVDYLDTALQEGIVRRVYVIVPDSAWVASMVEILQDQSVIIAPKKTDSDNILLHRGGRIHIMPLSQYIPESETSLVVYEPSFWSEQERQKIEGLLTTRQLDADLVALVK